MIPTVSTGPGGSIIFPGGRSSLKERSMDKIRRFGVSIEESLAGRFDEHIRGEGYGSRSEALRDLIREHLGLEVIILRGPNTQIKAVADRLMSTRGVKHGKLTLTTSGEYF